MVSTPWAIAQYNHKPQFPVVNTNIGIEGQNMLVIMNSIIPVKHISSLAKPATWGFFMLDLKRALSWNWFFPIFAGILSLWWMFYIVLNRRPITSFALSILFSISAYTVFWSTQVYSIISFAAISFCLAILILKNNKIIISSLLSIGLGLSIAGFILFLYPPWQISLAYLFLMIFIGVFLRDRLYSLISLQKILIYIIALAIVGILVWFWWIDSKNTIDIIRNTVYPGQRFRAGGTVPPLMLLRGFANMTGGWLLRPKGLFNIVPSYYYLFLPLTVVYFYILSKAPRKICYTLIPVALFSVFCMIYMFIGVPAFIAKYTLFYMVQGQRLNLALGLSYFFLCGIVFTNRDYLVNSKKYIILSYIISFLWVLIVLYIIIISKQELVWNTLLLSTVFLASYSLLTGNIKMFVVVYFFLNLPNLFFNPVAVAPDKFELKSNIENILFVNNDNTKAYRRVLALSNNQWPWDSYFPASLYAAGTPTVNGTFMYPQMKLWKKLDPDKKDINNYNRFQHLRFIAKSLPDHTNILIKAVGWGATVEVTVNAKSFNFDLTGAGIVVAPGHQYELLKQNTSLKFIKSLSGFTWFDVVKNNK